MKAQPTTMIQVSMPAADSDAIALAIRMAGSLGGKAVQLSPTVVQAAFADTSQGEHQLRDWLEIVAASQVGRTMDIHWWRANGGAL